LGRLKAYDISNHLPERKKNYARDIGVPASITCPEAWFSGLER
jgi:hypothetical protein